MIKSLLLIALMAGLAACSANNPLENIGPDALYERGTRLVEARNYQAAIPYFVQLEASYPFSNVTRQAKLDLIYAYYMAAQPESAIAAAEEFEREYPTHPRVDYTLWMRGLAYFEEGPNFLERMFRVDLSERPPTGAIRSYTMFDQLVRRYPQSEYADNARQRMVALRNRLAAYENHVARYSLQRGAYHGALARAKYAIEHYPGAPQLEESLEIMIEAYEMLEMHDLAADARRVLERTFGDSVRLD